MYIHEIRIGFCSEMTGGTFSRCMTANRKDHIVYFKMVDFVDATFGSHQMLDRVPWDMVTWSDSGWLEAGNVV